jgi:hypothetical protein
MYKKGNWKAASEHEAKGERDHKQLFANLEENEYSDDEKKQSKAWIPVTLKSGHDLMCSSIPGTGSTWYYSEPSSPSTDVEHMPKGTS